MTNFGRAKHIYNKFNEKGYLNKIDILLYAEKLLASARDVELRMNIIYCNQNCDPNRVKTIEENLQIRGEIATSSAEIFTVSKKVFSMLKTKLVPLKNDATFDEKSFKKLLADINQSEWRIDTEIGTMQANSKKMNTLIASEFGRKKEIIIDCRDINDVKLLTN